ncbi:SAG family member [Eimeria tenella]|uniref:SAG family member n=1 Tax=Eimeria tenella TaxID=5802 RepID=U6KYK4_EIMTE|nr:SAG family member [Eimeria tenella]CDJ43262.1 SAG family member [Eimeria tenella]|eukprot:XP_013234012.1 SAG family member [Eimeria tenella]
MTHIRLLACYAGLLASAAAPYFSSALSLRSSPATSQQNGLSTNLSVTGQELQRTTAPTGAEKTEDGLDIINKLRRENLKDLLGTLTKAQESEVTASLKEMGKTDPANLTAAKIAQTLAGSSETCELGENADAKTYPGLAIPFAHSTNFECSALIQGTYTAGLSQLKQSNFDPSTGTYDVESAPFNNVDASNVAFLLSAKSTKVSCAATEDCTGGHDVLFCYFIDPLRKGDKPFTTELYNALWGLEAGAASISVPSVATVLSVLALVTRT